MARAEFGRFYTDDQEQREVRRSLERAKARRTSQPHTPELEQEQWSARREPRKAGNDAWLKPKSGLWHQPSVRERRTEIADAKARLAASARLRKAGEGEAM